MAISIVQTADTDGAGGESSDTVTLVTPTTGNWLILYVGSAPNSTVGVASVSGGGVTTWTKAVAQAASTVADAEIWYGTVGSSPTTTVTVTYNSTQLSVRIGLIEASGVAGLDVTGSGTPTTDASGNASTPSITPAHANDLFFAVAADGGPNINAIASPWTAVVGGGGRAGYGGYYLPGDSAAHSATFTGNASQLFAVAIAAFYPGASNLTVTAQTAVLPVVPPVGQASTPYAAGQTPVLPLISAAATVTVTFTATAQTAVLPLVGVAATAVVTLPATVVPYTTDGYAYLQRTRTFRAVATVTPAVASAPSGVTLADFGVPQVSETYNQPTIIAGLPYADSSKNPWLPASTNRQTWAKQLQIVVGGQDVTFFRNAPVTGITWSSQEPFADATATFTLPAVTTYDSLPVAASLPTGEVVGIATSNTGSGYWQASAEGLVSAYGDAATLGDPLGLLNEPVSGIAAHPSQSGYVLCAQDGGVFAFNVGFHGNALGVNTSPVIGIAMTSTGNGYWLLEENGTIHNYGDAAAFGPASVGYPTNKATGIARSAGGSGVVVVASNGGVFCFGDATFHGNGINSYIAPYSGIATHPSTDGYVLVNELGDAYCQPLGTQVRVVRRASETHGTYGSYSYGCRCADCRAAQIEYQRAYRAGDRIPKGPKYQVVDVPIESVGVGDRVMSYDIPNRALQTLGAKPVTAVIRRPYSGRLIRVTTSDGYTSRYTPEHKCLALVGAAFDNKIVLYMMRREGQYRLGISAGRALSQSNAVGIGLRCRQQGGDAMWVLSMHDTEQEARTAEALAGFQHNVPTLEFVTHRPKENGVDLESFWNKVGDNSTAAERCLRSFGRDINRPFYTPEAFGCKWSRRPMVYHACNLLEGMRVLVADHGLVSGNRIMLWEQSSRAITVTEEWYDGEVISLDVEDDHTYVGDGIVTHNCFGSVPYKGGVPSSVTLAQPVNSVAMTTTGGGYWMSAGDGGVFTYGDAKFYGSIPGGGINVFGSLSWLRTGAPVTINRIDSSGNPHTLWEGVVLSWEDNTSTGNVGLQVQCTGCLFQADWLIAKPVVNMPFIGFNPETNLPVFGWDIGTAIAQAFNSAHNPSAGTALGSGPQPAPVGSAFNFNHCTPVQTGILTVSRGNWDKLATGYIQNMLAQAQNLSGFQWTVGIKRPRTPVIQTKNLLTTNWTVSAGARGVSYQLSYDQSTAATAIYGQGQAPPVLVAPGTGQALTGSWANSRYPQAYPSAVPAFPLATGHSYAPGDGQTGLRAFTDWMRQSGYPLISQDTYLATNQSQTIFDQYLVERFQQDAGLQVTGNIDSATWSAAFATGNNQAAVSSVFYAPLWQLKQVEPYTYSPSGAVTGTNPFFNPKVPRVERFEEMGQQITKAQGTISAQIEGERIQQPAWIGTVTLTCDPQEGSRFDIQAGQNIMLRWFRNNDTLFHISQVSVDFSAMTVQLTVTSQAADLQTLVSMWARDAQTHGVARVARPSLVTLNMSSNVTVFDAESGAGSVWPTSLTGGVWVVQRVPFSESGAIAAANFTSSPSTPFAVGVFSGPVAPSQLEAVFGSAGPLTADASGNNPWNDFAVTGSDGGPGLDFYGMLYGAGGPNGACGYWPSDPNGLQTLTGRYFDGQTWPYASAPGYYPWVWVALWAQSSCTINGRFLMAPMPTS